MADPNTPPRFSRRRWRRRLTGLRRVLIAVLAVAAVGFGVWVVFWSTWLGVDDVEVEGAQTLSTEQVLAAAAVPQGTPLARVDLEALGARVEELPEVAAAEAHRSWPDTVRIVVTERTAIASVRRSGAWWVLDAEGVVFRRTGDRVGALPVVRTTDELGAEGLSDVASVVAALPDEILAQTKQVQERTIDSITVELERGRRVVWGSATDAERKIEVLRVLLRRPATVYDVSVPEQPTTRSG